MRFRRLSNTFLVEAASEEEALRVEGFLLGFNELPTPEPEPAPEPVEEVDARDVVHYVDTEAPFPEQTDYTVQCISTYTRSKEVPQAGIHGSRLPDGSTLRFGHVDVGRKRALAFVLAPGDPKTSGNPRTELKLPDVSASEVYWVSFGLYVPRWGQVPSNDVAVVGFQFHSGGNTGLSPAVAMYARAGKTIEFASRYSLADPADRNQSRSPTPRRLDLEFDRWLDIVVRFKYGIPDGGSLHAWIDGDQVVEYGGPLGYKHRFDPYFKFGIYNWTSGLNSPRTVCLRHITVVKDPTGDKYSFNEIDALKR